MTTNEPVRVRIFVEARPSIDEMEIPRAEWDAMTPAERNAALDEAVQIAISNAGGAGYRLLDPADEKDL